MLWSLAMSVNLKTEPHVFHGHSGSIKSQLMTPSKTSNRLAVVLPGAGYSYREPLLRYGIQVLLKKNYQVLALDKLYGDDPEWRSISSEQEARAVVEQDTIKIFDQIKEKFPQPLEILFGRSLGTFAMACLLEKDLVRPQQIIWQTPALGNKWTVMKDCKIPGFGILGTADYYYEKAIAHLPTNQIVIENADHSMEIPGDPIQSIEILKKIFLALDQWICLK